MFLYTDYDSELGDYYSLPTSIVDCLAIFEESKTLDKVHDDVRGVLLNILSKTTSTENASNNLFTLKIY